VLACVGCQGEAVGPERFLFRVDPSLMPTADGVWQVKGGARGGKGKRQDLVPTGRGEFGCCVGARGEVERERQTLCRPKGDDCVCHYIGAAEAVVWRCGHHGHRGDGPGGAPREDARGRRQGRTHHATGSPLWMHSLCMQHRVIGCASLAAINNTTPHHTHHTTTPSPRLSKISLVDGFMPVLPSPPLPQLAISSRAASLGVGLGVPATRPSPTTRAPPATATALDPTAPRPRRTTPATATATTAMALTPGTAPGSEVRPGHSPCV
jgi:hypothetical protein